MIERKENIILQWPQMLSSRLIFLFASMDHILVSVDSIDRLLSFCCFWFKHSHNLSMFSTFRQTIIQYVSMQYWYSSHWLTLRVIVLRSIRIRKQRTIRNRKIKKMSMHFQVIDLTLYWNCIEIGLGDEWIMEVKCIVQFGLISIFLLMKSQDYYCLCRVLLHCSKEIAVTEFKAVYASPVLSLKRRKLIKPFNMYQNPIEQRDETKIFFGFFACLFDLFWAIWKWCMLMVSH